MENVITLVIGIVIVYISIKSLRDFKKLPNNSAYNIYHNSRFYRLLIVTLVGVVAVVTFLITNFF